MSGRLQAAFFLNRVNVSGVIKGGVIGGYKQTGRYKIDARFNKQDLIKRLKKIGELRANIVVSEKPEDGLAFMGRHSMKSSFTYIDPPYTKKKPGSV